MHRLLVPVDRSQNAARALAYAISLAGKSPAIELLIVTVHERAMSNPRALAYQSLEEVEREMQADSEAVLAPAIAAAKAAGVAFVTEILSGETAQAIAACAKARGCEGIVMGTRGMGAIANLVIGSTAMKVVHLSEVPVTLVR